MGTMSSADAHFDKSLRAYQLINLHGTMPMPCERVINERGSMYNPEQRLFANRLALFRSNKIRMTWYSVSDQLRAVSCTLAAYR